MTTKAPRKLIFMPMAAADKNSITPAMMLYTVRNSVSLKEISLRLFGTTNRGQNEGASAHNAIGHSLNKAGNLFLSPPISTVVALARSQQPCLVNQMGFEDLFIF